MAHNLVKFFQVKLDHYCYNLLFLVIVLVTLAQIINTYQYLIQRKIYYVKYTLNASRFYTKNINSINSIVQQMTRQFDKIYRHIYVNNHVFEIELNYLFNTSFPLVLN